MRTVVLACMRNEGPWLLEWVAHHHELGFTQVWICTNDLTDGSDGLLARLVELGLIRHFTSSVPPGVPAQAHGYAQMRADPAFAGFDWALVVDADEFLVLPPGITLNRFLAMRVGAAAIALNWKVFGHDRQVSHRPGLVTERFHSATTNGLARHYKCFCRPSETKRLTPHFPVIDHRRLLFIHANGTRLPGPPSGLSAEPDHSHGYINHYIAKSLEEMCAKVMRGRGAVGSVGTADFTIADAQPAADLDDAGERAPAGAEPLWRSVDFMVDHARQGNAPDGGIARYRAGTRARLALLAADPVVAAAVAEITTRYRATLASPPACALLAQVVDRLASGEGRITGVIDDELRGWICLPMHRPATRCIVLVDRRLLAMAVPNRPCAELPAGWPGSRAIGFAVRLPEHLRDGGTHLVTVHAIHDGRRAATCTAVVPLPPRSAPCRGRIDGVVAGQLIGWISTAEHGQVPGCRISIDGGAPYETVPDVFRADLLAHQVGDGRLGFIVPLPAGLCDDRQHRVEVDALADGRRVGGLSGHLRFDQALTQ